MRQVSVQVQGSAWAWGRLLVLAAAMLLAAVAGVSYGQERESSVVSLGQARWHKVGQRPQDLWFDAQGGPKGAGALGMRVFPGKSVAWASAPVPVEAGRVYVFSAQMKAHL
ncbi:MAG: hypothetical protein J7M26_02895, partial [Armatimonadetes bacterium]|nr:hypothetical protein [Armatimonadota bacterium]